MSREAGTPPLDQVRAAWAALDSGAFAEPSVDWRHIPPSVVVVGAHGGSGATTMALAIAHAMGTAHLLELAAPQRAGLIAATTAELGEITPGWWRGQRGSVVVERLARWPHTHGIPAPQPTSGSLVVDVADLAGHCGLESQPVRLLLEHTPMVVVTAAATLPGMRRLAVALEQAPDPARVAVALLGGPPRKWNPAVVAASPPSWRPGENKRVVLVTPDPGLAVTGLTPDPLPKGVLSAASQLLLLDREPQATPEGTHPK